MGTRESILDAAVEAASLFGLAKLSMSDVATRARVSRPTLYKYFGSKDDLIQAAVQREAVELVSLVLAAAEGHSEPGEALEAAFVTALALTREHPLLDRIIGTEPEALLPYLTTDRVGGDGGAGGAAVLLFVRTAAETLIRERLADRIDELSLRRLADVIARLLVSYAVSAPDDPPEVVAAVMATMLLEGALNAVPFDDIPAAEPTGTTRTWRTR
jgi:AcrR family transcriptional regulator